MSELSEAELFALFGPGGAVMRHLAARWAEPRAERVAIRAAVDTRSMGPLSPELLAWIELFERYELEAADPAEAELRAPGDLPSLGALLGGETGPSALADLLGLFAGATVIVQQDALSFLASLAGTSLGVSKVYAFHPEDWGLHPTDAAISVRLHRLEESVGRASDPFGFGTLPPGLLDPDADPSLGQEGVDSGLSLMQRADAARGSFERIANQETLPAHLDPLSLARRSDWLVKALFGLPFEAALSEARPLVELDEEGHRLGAHPHLALHWLFFHALLGNRQRLEAGLRATATATHPLVREARSALERWTTGRSARLGPLDRALFEALREVAMRSAPRLSLEAEAARARPSRQARAALEAAEDPEARAFLELFDHLATGAELGPSPFRGLSGLALEDKLAELARPRFVPLLDETLADGARVPDGHPAAGRGRILARAAVAKDLAELDRALAQAGGTERFGPRRRDETWRAVARFSGPEADARLARGAGAFRDVAEDWIRSASKVPWDALLERDTPATHELVVRFLGEAPLGPSTEPLFAEAAEAALRHGIRRAVPGLRRAVTGGAGRIDDGSRRVLVRAVQELDDEAGAFLRAVAERLQMKWEQAEDEDRAFLLAKDLAVVVGAILALEPAQLEAQALAAALLARFAVELSPRKAPSPDLLEALRALVEGAHAGDIRSLGPTLRAFSRLSPIVRPPARPAWERFREALRAALDALR